jgi:hypothetical protein
MGNGHSVTVLSDLGCTVIQSNVDFFEMNETIVCKRWI